MRHSAVSLFLYAFLSVASSFSLVAQTTTATAATTAAAATTATAVPSTASTTAAIAATSTVKNPPTWVLGLTRFIPAEAEAAKTILLSAFPRLIAADLKSLPTRRTPDEEAAEARKLSILRARFAAGTELAAKLDARALGFLDPSLGSDARKVGISAADKVVSDSDKKLDDALKENKVQDDTPSEIATKLWSGHADGQLIDPPGPDLAKAAKTAAVDLLVTGSIALESGYAKVVVRGYDASLSREVFSWAAFCSLDDPAPIAEDMARRLERWTAGRDFARLVLKPNPGAAELRVNGELLSGSSRVAYVYKEGPVVISATASGYSPLTATVDLALGDRKSQQLDLAPLSTGKVSLSTDPAGASISLDSVSLGQAPISIGLDGSRPIVSVEAKGRESQTIVLPTAGDVSIGISLLPSDGLGPSGRISAARDKFYSAFGWFVLSIPLTSLSYSFYKGYDDAFTRSGYSSQSLYDSRGTTETVLSAAVAASTITAVFMVIRLVKYIRAAH